MMCWVKWSQEYEWLNPPVDQYPVLIHTMTSCYNVGRSWQRLDQRLPSFMTSLIITLWRQKGRIEKQAVINNISAMRSISTNDLPILYNIVHIINKSANYLKLPWFVGKLVTIYLLNIVSQNCQLFLTLQP